MSDDSIIQEALNELNDLALEANQRSKKKVETRDSTKGRKEGETVDIALVRKVFPVGTIPSQPYTLLQAQTIGSWMIKEAIKIWLILSPSKKINQAPKIMNMIFQYTKRHEEINYLKEAIRDLEIRREEDSRERREIVSRSGGPTSATEELLKEADLK